MEVLLQVWDELDDWYGCLRHVWLGVRTDLGDMPSFSKLEVTFTSARPAIAPAE